jgi:hypothetical protein
VLDAGTTNAGRPYFVTELVKGVPITQYCDEARLTTRQRLEPRARGFPTTPRPNDGSGLIDSPQEEAQRGIDAASRWAMAV